MPLLRVVIRMTLVQIDTQDAMRGRVNAVNSLFAGSSNQLGNFRAGLMAAGLGAIPAVLIGGIGVLLAVSIWTRAFPALAHVDGSYGTKRWPAPQGPAGNPTRYSTSGVGAGAGSASQWFRNASSQARPAGS